MANQSISVKTPPLFAEGCLGPSYTLRSFSTYRQFRDWLPHNGWMHDIGEAHRIAASALGAGISSAWLGRIAPEDMTCVGSNYRESLQARGLSARQRAVLDLLTIAASRFAPETPALYATEGLGSFAAELRLRFPRFVGSEYAPTPAQQAAIAPIEHQDVGALTYSNARFDLAVSNDVFEHVPDLPLALSEMRRVLKKDGLLLATFPFLPLAERTVVKARCHPDGSIDHLAQPEYHDNPLDPQGSLVFQIPGWDITDMALQAGFTQCEQMVITSELAGLTGAEGPGLFIFAARV